MDADSNGVRIRKMVPKVSETEIELTTFAPIHLNGSACNSEHSVCEETNDNEPLLLERTDEVRVARHRLTSQSSLSGDEPWWQIALQVFFPFLVAGFGMVGAGMVLDIVQHWDVFIHVTDVFILVPALLGLKGNLEMTLASRLSTQANLGHVDSRKDQLEIIAGNLALTQAQAVVVGFLAAIAAVVMGWVPNGQFNMDHALLLCASSVVTASLASLVLGSIMIAVVLLSRKCRVNPDNIATPIAASLGDLTTLGLLASVTSLLYNLHDSQKWVAPLIIAVFILSIPLWVFISHRNKFVHDVLYDGWEPVIAAMMISSVGGLVLDYTVLHYDGIAVFQPVINGVGGNLVAVQASRLATALHQSGMPLGKLPESASSLCPTPCRAFFGKGTGAKAARVLLMMVVPGHLIFIFTITYLHGGHTTTSVKFSAFYLAAALVQVALLLFIASWMVPFAWRRKKDPDNVCIPYLTALGDLIGTALLAVAFYILDVTGDQDTDLGD